MSFIELEESNYEGRPVALYEFRRGSYVIGYASSDTVVTAGGRTYEPLPITDAGMTQKGTAVTDSFEVTCPQSLEVVGWFTNTPPTDTIYLTVRRFHWGDSESVIMWLGQVVAVTLNADETAKITASPVAISLKRGGLRLAWQRGCPHALYDQNCQADKSAFKVETTLAELFVDKLRPAADLTAGGQFWPGGIIEWTLDTGVIEKRMIKAVDLANNWLYPFGFMDGFSAGQSINLYPGCKRTSIWCNNFFANLPNYGGIPWMPIRSPYDGDPVF